MARERTSRDTESGSTAIGLQSRPSGSLRAGMCFGPGPLVGFDPPAWGAILPARDPPGRLRSTEYRAEFVSLVGSGFARKVRRVLYADEIRPADDEGRGPEWLRTHAVGRLRQKPGEGLRPARLVERGTTAAVPSPYPGPVLVGEARPPLSALPRNDWSAASRGNGDGPSSSCELHRH